MLGLTLASLAGACSSSGDSAGGNNNDGAVTDAGDRAVADAANDGAVTDAADGNGGVDAGNASSVNLATSGNFAILAKSGISTVPTSAITGNLGVSPAAATFITGFSLTMDSGNVFATSPQVTGHVFASDYALPTPSNLTTAIGDMQLAFTDAAGRAPDVTELGAGNVGGMTLERGVYKWGTGLPIPTDVTLKGSATDVWTSRLPRISRSAARRKSYSPAARLPKNVFWQVSGKVPGTTAHFVGVVSSQTSIALETGASVDGRLFAQTAVTLDGSTVVQPAP